ncbi:MAG: hypothetical protein KDC05_07765 [Bacteroidales bacterium]|nr:hypothetical protein [Bacteroidales bacterium]
MKQFLLFFFVVMSCLGLYSQTSIRGDIKYWHREDFMGFDPAGDAESSTGDITSVYLKKFNNKLAFRITFDNMVERVHNLIVTNHFLNHEVIIRFRTGNEKSKQLDKTFLLSSISHTYAWGEYLVTPENNLFEAEIATEMLQSGDFDFTISVMVDGQLADTFTGSTKGTMDSGNCAFVHHGNQGLTYTDVFYGNAFGISGLDGSGYDEVLQVHEATGIPGNFHMSGTLMPAAEWHNPEFNDWLTTLAGNGIASMMTSALGQNIMPFATNDMNDWSVYIESQMVDFHYNYVPRVAWVPERVWLAQGSYPDAGVIDWLGDNWSQHGVWGVVLDDWPHLNGYDNRKIHWMNNGLGISLRVIPIDNSFVGYMHYDATAAKNHIASMGQYNLCVYGTDWEVAAEMNEHDGTFFLDNYEDVMWYCHDNYPGINVWKLEDAIMNPGFNGTGAEITPGTYGLLGGSGGYGGSNNSWYINWASTPSHSDFHEPRWNYGYIWSNAFDFLVTVPENNLSQLAWYTLMINLHETGWHTSGDIADWEHRYSAHIKNANVYSEAARWADGLYATTTACYFEDIDRDGIDEIVMHNDKVFMVFESIGGKANWVFYKDGLGNAYSVVSSDMAYWSETDGDYNDGSNNHVAALSDVSPNQQHSVFNMSVDISSGDTVQATLDQWGVQKVLTLATGADYLDVIYNFYSQTGYVKSGWSPDLLDLIWSGKTHLQRVWGGFGSYCGYRNSASGATAALLLGNGGASHNSEFEGTLVRGDEIKGYNVFKVRLFAGFTSEPTGTSVAELDALSLENMDVIAPQVQSPAALVSDSEVMLTFNEAVEQASAENIVNYSFQGFLNSYTLISAERQSNWNKVKLTISGQFVPADMGNIVIINVEDLNGNPMGTSNVASLTIPTGFTPHTVIVDDINDFQPQSELMATSPYSLYLSWDDNNLYVGLYSLDLNSGGDLFVNIDIDQAAGSGAGTGSWGRVDFTGNHLPEYQVAIEGGGVSMQFNNWDGASWNYPGSGAIGNSYEGWASNGLTTLSIPWSEMGDPNTIALSVHVTEEDSEVVTAAFPVNNPTGFHPVLNSFYALFTPYVPGDMPLSGFAPNTAFVVPNTAAHIDSYLPVDINPEIELNNSQSFYVFASDDENDPVVYQWIRDGILVGNSDSYLYESDGNDIGNHLLQAIVSDEVPGNDPDTVSWEIEVVPGGFIVDLNIFLEGPYNGVDMETGLNASGHIPLFQPYNTAPWNYDGTEQVLSIPGIDVVDWVLIEARDAAIPEEATGSSVVGRQAAFLMKNGSVRSFQGNSQLAFGTSLNEGLFIVVYHRDHLPVMSSVPLTETSGVFSYDFSTAESQVYGGADGFKELSPGVWGMVGGDANADGYINASDYASHWSPEAGLSGYKSSDFSLDSEVDNKDKNNIWLPNSGAGSQVPESVSKYSSQVPK